MLVVPSKELSTFTENVRFDRKVMNHSMVPLEKLILIKINPLKLCHGYSYQTLFESQSKSS